MTTDFQYCNTGKCPHRGKCERHVKNHFFEPESKIWITTFEFYGKKCPMFVTIGKDEE